MTAAKRWSVSGDWLAPGDGPPIRGGVMRGRGLTIEAVGDPRQVPHAEDHRTFSGAAILPGLVNTHTHLEQTHLAGRLRANRPFAEWFELVEDGQLTGKEQATCVLEGAAQAAATGTTALADISHNNCAWRALKKSPLRTLCMGRIIGLTDEAALVDKVTSVLKGVRTSQKLRFGLAPHAPYSTSRRLYKHAISSATQRHWLVATHLAETEAERQFLLHGLGMFAQFRRRFGSPDPAAEAYNCTPVAFARRIGLLEVPSLLAHVNCIDDDDLQILAGGKASVAYCPRANAFFGRSAHRYADMIGAGINVALGTDGMGDNTDVDMIDEMRRVRFEGRVPVDTILRMATLNGAKALGWDDKIGSLAPGKLADWVAVTVPAGAGHPVEAILTLGGEVLETTIAGQTVYRHAEPTPAE